MTWISLVCLLALSSAVFGRSVSFDGYGSTRVIQPPVQSGYGQELLPAPEVRINSGYGSSVFVPPMTRTLPVSNYGGYGSSSNRVLERELVVETLPPTQEDILCRGQLPQTVIPIDGNTKFVVCLDDGKGTVQACPERLLYNEQTRRCEHTLGPREDFCASQPCLNGGLCLSGDSTFQCQCAPGFDGIVCELDASFCQNNRPCGSDSRVKCQSFRPGAALQWICVADDFTYGPDGQHIHRSPCGSSNGPHALAYTDKGFILCNGVHSSYESCPGGTKWENRDKACIWPDMEEIGETRFFGKSGYGDSFISQPAPTRVLSSYGGETRRISSYGSDVVPMPETRTLSSYGAPITKTFSSYGAPEIKTFSSYGAPITKTFSSYGAPETKIVSSYGAPMTKTFSSYGAPETKTISSYGGDVILPAMHETRSFSSYGAPITKTLSSYSEVPETKTISSYGGDVVLPAMPETRIVSGYGGVPETKTFSSYGGSRLIVPQPHVKVASYGGY